MIAVSYLMKRKIKKIFPEVISNNKILYIFYNEVANNQDFAKLTGALVKGGGGLDNVEYGTKQNLEIKFKLYLNLEIIEK